MDPPKDDREPMEEESDEEQSPMEQAMKAVRSGMSQNKAAKTFNVCRATLANKLKGKHLGRWGGQCRFDPREELILLDAMKQCRALGLQINRQKNIRVVERMAASKGGCLILHKVDHPVNVQQLCHTSLQNSERT